MHFPVLQSPQPMQISFLEQKNVVSFSLPLSAVKHVFYSMFFVHMVVFVCPCVGVVPEKSW